MLKKNEINVNNSVYHQPFQYDRISPSSHSEDGHSVMVFK